jgi:hypothetical protein
MKTFFSILLILFLNLQLISSTIGFVSSQEKGSLITSNSEDEFDDEEGSEEEQENEEIEENA